MKVAVCISGQMRSFEKCISSLKYLDNIKPDIFLYTWNIRGSTFIDLHDYENDIITMDKLKEYNNFNMKKIIIEYFNPNYYNEINGIFYPEFLKKIEPFRSTMLPMYYLIYNCNQIKIKQEQYMGYKYDIVIRLRPDEYLTEYINENVLEDILLNKVFYCDEPLENNLRSSDKFALSTSEVMDYYSSLFLKLNDYWKNPIINNKLLLCEELIGWHMNQCNIIKKYYKNPEILRFYKSENKKLRLSNGIYIS